MGSIYNRGTRSKPNWWIRWTDAQGVRQARSVGPERTKAVDALNKIEGDVTAVRLGQKFDLPVEQKKIPTFEDAAKEWIKRRSAQGKDGRPAVRSWKDDKARLDGYLIPFFGSRPLNTIRKVDVKGFIEKVRPKLAAQSIRNCLAILSRLFNDYIEDDYPLVNPVSRLDRATRRAIGAKWDPKKTPFLRTGDDIRAVYQALPEMGPKSPWRAMFAVGVFAGLRTGEVQALRWADVDFEAKRLHIRQSVDGPLKDDDTRIVPLSPTLARVLREWEKASPPSKAVCFPSTGKRGQYVKAHSMYEELHQAQAAAKVPRLTWYQATRHTFASHWVINGGSLEKLRVILGHSTTEVTLRYAHLIPGQFTESERSLVSASLWDAEVVELKRG